MIVVMTRVTLRSAAVIRGLAILDGCGALKGEG